MKVCKDIIPNCYGYDISTYPIPEGVVCFSFKDKFYEVITFFDSLEHFEDIEFVKDLKCSYVCVSVPIVTTRVMNGLKIGSTVDQMNTFGTSILSL